MNVEELREYCLSKPHSTEGFPFDEHTLVFKVHGKMFALCGLKEASYVNLKCDPERAIQLRAEYQEITPGYHMSKKHWNSVSIIGFLSDEMIKKLVDDSYQLIWKSLPKKLRE